MTDESLLADLARLAALWGDKELVVAPWVRIPSLPGFVAWAKDNTEGEGHIPATNRRLVEDAVKALKKELGVKA